MGLQDGGATRGGQGGYLEDQDHPTPRALGVNYNKSKGPPEQVDAGTMAAYRMQIAEMREQQQILMEENHKLRMAADRAQQVPTHANGLQELEREELERYFFLILP